MNFTLTILGSASALPFSDRNPSAQALSVHGRLFLLDCGEGTQQRIRQEHLSFVKIEAVFISHIHGDHCFGLFGLLSTMSLYHRVAPLHIFGPQNLGPIIKFYLSYFGQDLGYEIVFHPITAKSPVVIAGTPAMTTKNVTVTAFPLNHKMDCYGYRFDEIVEPLRLLFKDEVRAAGLELGIPYELVWRQPFPGPGLAIRVLGEVTEEKLAVLRECDAVFREEVIAAGLEQETNQYFAVLTDSRTVGVMGDAGIPWPSAPFLPTTS